MSSSLIFRSLARSGSYRRFNPAALSSSAPVFPCPSPFSLSPSPSPSPLSASTSSASMRLSSSGAAAAFAKRGIDINDIELPPMFCFQCEQTREGTGCSTTEGGVCGKTPEVANMQDLLMHALKGISYYAAALRRHGHSTDPAMDRFLLEAVFSTLTNVNFDAGRFVSFLEKADEWLQYARNEARSKVADHVQSPPIEAQWTFDPSKSSVELAEEGHGFGVIARREQFGEDISGLQELVTYGLKGMMAYSEHAAVLGHHNDQTISFLYEALNQLTNTTPTVEDMLSLALKVGEANLTVLETLDKAHTSSFGHPEPVKVRITPVEGKCILVSGHDLGDLHEILKQTEGKGINVYTHGEMLPAHGYPELRKFKHLVGNYGGAWQNQKTEFKNFPGPIVMTSNCIIEPRKSYRDRIFTRSIVGYPGVHHLVDNDFSQVVAKAMWMEGFDHHVESEFIMTGFGHNAVLGVADQVVNAVKSGDLKHIFLIGGCDGAEGQRNYFKEVATNVPDDCLILTLACGKYRFNKLNFGTIGNLPRLIDMGQCNDAYSAIKVASALAEVFGTDVNGLPLSFVVSWFEQKAVCILLTLLHLGVKNIRLGPNLPAFVTPNMLDILVKNYNIKPTDIDNVPLELENMLKGQ